MSKELTAFIDARCVDCPDADTYRMVGACSNCCLDRILFLFTAGHRTSAQDCPRCGCRSAYAKRAAGDDEIPAAVEQRRGEKRP